MVRSSPASTRDGNGSDRAHGSRNRNVPRLRYSVGSKTRVALRFHAFLTGALLLVVTLSLAHAQTPRTVRQYYERGQTRYEQGDFDGAIADFGRGTVLSDKNEIEKAIRDFDRAIELDPRLARAYANRGLARLRRGEEVMAAKDFERCLEVDPTMQAELDEHIKRVRAWREGHR